MGILSSDCDRRNLRLSVLTVLPMAFMGAFNPASVI